MAACGNQVGVKNIVISFLDCETGATYGPLSHELSGDDLPTIRICPYNNDALPGGYVKRKVSNDEIEMKIIRDLRIPLALYQGCASLNIQIEYYNGLVYSAVNGTGTGDDKSDTHEVTVKASFREIDELLPAGILSAAA